MREMKEHLRKRTFLHLFMIVGSVLLLVLVSFVVLARFFAPPAGHEVITNSSNLEKVIYSSSQAVLNYDNSEKTITDPSDLQNINNQLLSNDIEPKEGGSGVNNGCTGGKSINLQLFKKDGAVQKVNISRCANNYSSTNSSGNLEGFYNFFVDNYVN